MHEHGDLSPTALGTPKRRHRRRHHHNIEVGSESLLDTSSDCLTDDNVMQKLDTGAILVHGKEELPSGYNDDNRRVTSHPMDIKTGRNAAKFEETVRRHRPRNRQRRYFSDDEIAVRKHQEIVNGAGTNGTNGVETENNLQDDDNHPRLDTIGKDKNANAKTNNKVVNGSMNQKQSATLPRRRRRRAMSGSVIGNHPLPPHRVTPDGTAIYYWCDIPRRPGSQGNLKIP